MCIEIENVEHEAYRMKYEYYSIFHLDGGMRTPIVERKELNKIL